MPPSRAALHLVASDASPQPAAHASGDTRPDACANCDAALVGPYCAACGQRASAPEPTLREVVAEAAEELTSVDGKLLATLRALLRPGRLTTEWLAGRRARYVSPLRTYLAGSVLLFAALALQPDRGRRADPHQFVLFGGLFSFRYAPDAAVIAADDRGELRGVRGAVQRRLLASQRAGPEAHARLERAVSNALPQAVFLLVPAYAALVMAAYRGRRRGYPQHLWFALHVHAFVFATLAGLFAVRAAAFHAVGALDSAAAANVLTPLVALAGVAWALTAAWYVAVAFRRTYGGTWGGTAVRLVLVHAGYWVLTAGAMFALLTLVALRG